MYNLKSLISNTNMVIIQNQTCRFNSISISDLNRYLNQLIQKNSVTNVISTQEYVQDTIKLCDTPISMPSNSLRIPIEDELVSSFYIDENDVPNVDIIINLRNPKDIEEFISKIKDGANILINHEYPIGFNYTYINNLEEIVNPDTLDELLNNYNDYDLLYKDFVREFRKLINSFIGMLCDMRGIFENSNNKDKNMQIYGDFIRLSNDYLKSLGIFTKKILKFNNTNNDIITFNKLGIKSVNILTIHENPIADRTNDTELVGCVSEVLNFPYFFYCRNINNGNIISKLAKSAHLAIYTKNCNS